MNHCVCHICHDLIPLIVSFADYDNLYSLSKASPMFDKIIYRANKRALNYRDRIVPIFLDNYVILAGGSYIAICGNKYTFLSNNETNTFKNRKIYDCHILPFGYQTYYLGLFDMCLFYKSKDNEYVLVHATKLSAKEGRIAVTTRGCKMHIDRYDFYDNRVTRNWINNEYRIKVIDFDTNFIVSKKDGHLDVSSFIVMFDGYDWIK